MNHLICILEWLYKFLVGNELDQFYPKNEYYSKLDMLSYSTKEYGKSYWKRVKKNF